MPPSSEDINTYTGLLAVLGVFGTAFSILFKSNRQSLKDQRTVVESLNAHILKQDHRIDRIEKEKEEEIARADREVVKNRILMRYLSDAGVSIRDEDKKILGI